jgi:uncharacterized protein (TIRG00374 family)
LDQFEQLKKDRAYVEEKTHLSDKDIRKKKRNKIILTVLFVLVNVGAILITGIIEFTKDEVEYIDFLGLNMTFLIAAVGCIAAAIFFETFKYCIMMKHTVGRVNIRHAFQTAVLGKYYDNITPSGAGGQPFQIYFLRKNGYAPGVAGAMPVLGFLSMQLGFCLLFFLLVITNAAAVESAVLHVSAYIGILFYLLVPMGIILFNFFPVTVTNVLAWGVRLLGKMKIFKRPEQTQEKMVKSLEEYRLALAEMAKVKGLIFKVMVVGILYQIALCSTPFFVLRAFGAPASYFNMLTLTVYIYAAIAYIPTPGNAGAAEGTFYSIFSGLKHAFWGMTIWRFLTYYLFLLLGVGVYGYNALEPKLRKRKEKNESN